jgi:hypothetical protein
MTKQEISRIAGFSEETLDKEIMFAEAALDPEWPATQEWLDELYLEMAARG